MTTKPTDMLAPKRAGRNKPPLTISTDAFDPPLTMDQAEQVQDFINRGIIAAGWEKSEADETTMAEEPIEQRLQRAWLNGFKEGVDRASFAATEATGRWDY